MAAVIDCVISLLGDPIAEFVWLVIALDRPCVERRAASYGPCIFEGREAVLLQFSFRPRNPVGQQLMMHPPIVAMCSLRAPALAEGISVTLIRVRATRPGRVIEDGEAVSGRPVPLGGG
jgi:hypothetical protein